MGEWPVSQWIVGVISFQKIFGLYGLKHHIVEISGDVTDAGRDEQTNSFLQILNNVFPLEFFFFEMYISRHIRSWLVKMCKANEKLFEWIFSICGEG